MMSDVWVRVADWMLADGEPATPNIGALLCSVGLRVRGAVTAADPSTPDGIVDVAGAQGRDAGQHVYAMTGVAGEARDIWMRTTRRGPDQHAGAEFVLSVATDQFQVQFDGRAAEVLPGAHLTVVGPVELVGEYEWEDFGLRDTRADWLVSKVVLVPDGDAWVHLGHEGEQG